MGRLSTLISSGLRANVRAVDEEIGWLLCLFSGDQGDRIYNEGPCNPRANKQPEGEDFVGNIPHRVP